MKKSTKFYFALLACAATVSSSAYAAKPGSYIGLGLGASKQETSNQYLFPNAPTGVKQSKPSAGFAAGAFTGYNFNPYLGIEAGIHHLAPASYKSSVGGDYAKLDYTMNTIDLVGKAYLPFGESGFNVYALGGAALVRSTVDAKASVGGVVRSESHKQTKIRPTYGVGASYDIPNSQATAGLEFKRIQGLGNVKTDSNAIPTANMVTFNLAYNLD